MIAWRSNRLLILSLALIASCSKGVAESAPRSEVKIKDPTSDRRSPKTIAPNELLVDGVGVAPGIWVDKAEFAKLDVADPLVLNEDIDTNGIRIRWWQHLGKGFEWVSTNLGMDSPDGPYWISQVSSKQLGACYGTELCVGQKLTAMANDTEFTRIRNGLELNITIEAGRVKTLLLSAKTHPR